MTTNWAYPSTFSQYAETDADNIHVSWQELDSFKTLRETDNKKIKTIRDLVHIAKEPRHDLKEKTYFLKITNFNFVNIPTTPTGIELRIIMNRFGRITDETIQLTYGNELIGNNMADLNLNLNKIYGDSTDMWGTSLSAANIAHSTFGVILRFQSHPNYPHKCSPFIDAVELRIH